MDLSVNHRIIAAVDIRPVQLARLLGAFELIVPFSGTVHATADGAYHSLTITCGRISVRAKSGQRIPLGRAVSDNGVVIRQYDNPTRTDFALKLTLQPNQLEALERERDGADLHLTILLQARASSGGPTTVDWEENLGEMPVVSPRSLWIDELNQSGASRVLVLEIRLPNDEIRHPAERHLHRAQEMFSTG